MKLIKSLILSSLFLVVIFITSCTEGPTTSVEQVGVNQQLSKFSLPPGADLSSATLHIYINVANNKTVNIYAISETWEETTVTWNTKPAVHDPAPGPVEAWFVADAVGWKEVDITGIAGKWLDGTYTNFGLLFDQLEETPGQNNYANYDSRRGTNKPYLVISYTGVTSGSANLADSADAYIQEGPDPNYTGNTTLLWTGYGSGWEKQALMAFAIEPTPPQVSCETSYAYQPEDSPTPGTCFSDLGLGFSNWGWSIYLPGTGTYTFPVYAGAGQCDITKGTLVGDVTVNYTATGVTFEYDFLEGFSTDETHFYAGKTTTPLKWNNKTKAYDGPPTVSPGQYYITPGLTGEIYIIAHAVVCSSTWDD